MYSLYVAIGSKLYTRRWTIVDTKRQHIRYFWTKSHALRHCLQLNLRPIDSRRYFIVPSKNFHK